MSHFKSTYKDTVPHITLITYKNTLFICKAENYYYFFIHMNLINTNNYKRDIVFLLVRFINRNAKQTNNDVLGF